MRIAVCQLEMRPAAGFEDFLDRLRRFISEAAAERADFIVFPEYFTFALLGGDGPALSPADAISELSRHTDDLRRALSSMAREFAINIIGGSHPVRMLDGAVRNLCLICLRDGTVHLREKVHATPDESACWAIAGGAAPDIIETDCGPIGVLICYDSEFPELARRLADQGAEILFVPFCTEVRAGYLRVRYCAQARAVENQCYVVLSGNVGELEGVANMDVQYAQSCILTPCDTPFARDGIAAEAEPDVEMLIIADVDLADLAWARAEGTVRNLADRRAGLYRIEWDDKAAPDGN